MIHLEKEKLYPYVFWRSFALSLAFLCWVAPARAENDLLSQLDSSLQAEEFDSAIAVAEELIAAPNNVSDLTLPLARLARTLQQSGQLETAARFYQESVIASQRPQAESLESEKKQMLRIATSLVLIETGKLETAFEVLAPIAQGAAVSEKGEAGDLQKPDELRNTKSDRKSVAESQTDMTCEVLIRIGSSALSRQEPSLSNRAFSLACAIANTNQEAKAKLGRAWSKASLGDEPLIAAEELEAFLSEFPDHPDSAQVAGICIKCYHQAGQTDAEGRVTAELLSNWPDSEVAWTAVREFEKTPPSLVPVSVKNWLLDHSSKDALARLTPSLLAITIVAASEQELHPNWTSVAKQLARMDEEGIATQQTLRNLTQMDRESQAEKFASMLIAPAKQDSITAPSREAACRWAGRTARWSLLATACETEDINQPGQSRTKVVERLIAEALTQTGNITDAAKWWNHLVDQRGASDFATLLRCAEAETSTGSESGQAASRIEAARVAADGDAFQLALVNLLAAELHIRKTKFDQARALLEQIIRTQGTETALRGRSQWLIGETFFLQRQYANAIEAYRKVEGIDPTGPWVAASMIQAGKSFEQLGYTVEASTCYGNLVTRFSETSHAELARKRLAALSPRQSPSSESTKTPIRR